MNTRHTKDALAAFRTSQHLAHSNFEILKGMHRTYTYLYGRLPEFFCDFM
jgi:hypothetical protein